MADSYMGYLSEMKIFHVLDGLKIGGIENQALTLSSEVKRDGENILLNLNKNINDYSKTFLIKKHKNLKLFRVKERKNLFISWIVFKKFKKYKSIQVIIYFNNINSFWVVLGAKLAGVSNIAICIQNAVRGISFKKL